MFGSKYPEKFKIAQALDLFGIKHDYDYETQQFLLNEISEYLFDVSVKGTKSSARIFDYNLDFKYYYMDFLKYGVDLLEQKVSWHKFNLILGEIMLMNGTRMSEVLEARTYERPPKYKNSEAIDQAEHKYKMERKKQYSLPQITQDTEKGFDKLWGYLEKKAGDMNE